MPAPETQLVQQLARSRYWRYLRDFLIDRREQMIAATPETTELLWRKEGAIHELNLLLKSPELLLVYFRKQAAGEGIQADTPTPKVPSWLGALAGTDPVE